MTDIRSFFDEQSQDWRARQSAMARVHGARALAIEAQIGGRTVAVGGLWPGASAEIDCPELAIVDLSSNMLRVWSETKGLLISADARSLPFATDSIDTLVFPMILHHIGDGTGSGAKRGVCETFKEARRVCHPDGRIIVLDYTISHFVYGAELALCGITRRLLALKGIPLVIMHPFSFYRTALIDAGFHNIEEIQVEGHREDPWQLVQPVIGVPWLRLPRFCYPVRPVLFKAVPT